MIAVSLARPAGESPVSSGEAAGMICGEGETLCGLSFTVVSWMDVGGQAVSNTVPAETFAQYSCEARGHRQSRGPWDPARGTPRGPRAGFYVSPRPSACPFAAIGGCARP